MERWPLAGIMIGVGKAGCAGLPSLRTGLADLPHPALRLVITRVCEIEQQMLAADMRATRIPNGEIDHFSPLCTSFKVVQHALDSTSSLLPGLMALTLSILFSGFPH